MSIVTKTGDAGQTRLMYNKKVPKTHPRVEAYGSVDELNAALGMARAAAKQEFLQDNVLWIQKDLVILMGELATEVEDLERFTKDGFSLISSDMTARLEGLIQVMEKQEISFKGWATPGNTPVAAALDLARTTCRHAERRVCGINEQSMLKNPEIIVYLNRLSDCLWLMARWAETNADAATRPRSDLKPADPESPNPRT